MAMHPPPDIIATNEGAQKRYDTGQIENGIYP